MLFRSSVDADVFLLRMFAAALRGNIANSPFQDFQEGLLHAFAGDIAGEGNVFGLARNLVDFVDVDDAALGALHVVVRILEQAQNNVLDVFADVAGFGERGSVGNRERNLQHAGERLCQQRLADAGRADQQDIRLLDLDRKSTRLNSSH